MSFNITELKKHLGPGLGLRKAKYLIEIPVPGIDGQSLNILCRSAGLPERNLATVSTFHKGRKYNMRAEHEFPGTYDISLVDDSGMNIRRVFDKWMKKIDDTKPKNSGILGASFEGLLGEIKDGIELLNNVQNAFDNGGAGAIDFFMGFLDSGNANSGAKYQTDVNIWQLSNTNEKVYGYKLQNCFPSSMGIVTLDDGEENALSEFNVTLTYSEMIPLENESLGEKILGGVLGDDVNDILDGVENLFD